MKDIFSTINFRISTYLSLYNSFTLSHIHSSLYLIYRTLRAHNSTHWEAKWNLALKFANRKNNLIKKRHQWKKKLSSLIMKIHNVEQINRLIKDDFMHEYSQIFCELFVNNCRIKQCFNCQRYDHIDKICRHERRSSICVESHDDSTCKIS